MEPLVVTIMVGCGVFIIMVIVATILDRKDRKIFKSAEAKKTKEFEEANRSKVAMILFYDIDGNLHRYGPFRYRIFAYVYDTTIRQSAKEKAEESLGRQLSKGYLINNDDHRIPACNVKKVWVEEVLSTEGL